MGIMKSPSSEHMHVPFPYVKGQQFTVRSHVPPPPTPLKRGCCLESDAGRLEREKLHPIDRCLLHPPLPGSDGLLKVDFKIIHPICVGSNHHHAQVVVVNIVKTHIPAKGLNKGKTLVAKIYDPLYAADEDNYVNPFLVADKNYTHETATYMKLADLQGSLIPQYYGSFSLEIPTGRQKPRYVRLILIEFIPGSSMLDIDPSNLSQSHRQHIMKSIIDFTTLLYTRDMVHQDLFRRNILVINAGSDEQKVIFIDFGDMRLSRTAYAEPELESEYFPGTYVSPLLKWHEAHGRTSEFRDWIDWDWQPWLEAEYGHTRDTITKEMQDKFLPDYILNPPSLEELYSKDDYWHKGDDFNIDDWFK